MVIKVRHRIDCGDDMHLIWTYGNVGYYNMAGSQGSVVDFRGRTIVTGLLYGSDLRW